MTFEVSTVRLKHSWASPEESTARFGRWRTGSPAVRQKELRRGAGGVTFGFCPKIAMDFPR